MTALTTDSPLDPLTHIDAFYANYSKMCLTLRFAEDAANRRLVDDTWTTLNQSKDAFCKTGVCPSHVAGQITEEIHIASLKTFTNIKEGDPVRYAAGTMAARQYAGPGAR